jgi:hypothetical protein
MMQTEHHWTLLNDYDNDFPLVNARVEDWRDQRNDQPTPTPKGTRP